jgi:hypothetical protein
VHIAFEHRLADQVSNLREDILVNRLKYALASMEEDRGFVFIRKARKALEK